jgi:outer membrane protein assembly factor BamB/enterochelin esterase-like enzyme
MSGLAAIVFVSAQARAVPPKNWPGFRGEDGTGSWNYSTILSREPAIALNVAWKTPIGSGYSGVAVRDKYVVTMFTSGDDDVAAAFDKQTGKELWRLRLEDKFPGEDGAHDGPISTPAIDEHHVYCLTPRGRFVAVDLKTGKEAWATELEKDHGAKPPRYGFATSPIVVGDVVALEVGGEDRFLMGFDAKTGKKRWSVGTDMVMWQTPIVVKDDKSTAHILAVGAQKFIAINPSDGTILYEFPHGGQGAAASSPVPAGKDRLFLHHKDEGSAIYKLSGEGKDYKGEITWDNRNIRKTFNVPVYYEGHIYAYSVRFLTCVDAETGEPKWRSRAPGDGFMILVDGHLVIITKNGTMHIAKATPEGYEERASAEVFDDVAWDHPAFVDDSVFVRCLNGLARVDIKPAAAPALAVVTNPMPETDARFHAFLERVEKAEDKPKVIDEYLSRQKQFPIIEQGKFVHFIYYGEAKDVAVAGDLWGARQERPMERVKDTNLFYYSAEVEPDARLSYCFIKDFTEVPDPRNDRKALISVVGKDMEMSMGGSTLEMSWFSMPQWKAPTYFEPGAAVAKGRIETQEIDSELLQGKHKIEVYVPAGYDDSEDRYPVAYVHGGAAANSLGEMGSALDGIIGKRTAPMLVVFIYHSPSFSPNDNYSDVFAKEIIPFVDDKYRTIAEPSARASVGHGFAGFTAMSATFANKGLIGKVGCQSPFMFGSMAQGLKPMIPQAKDTPIEFYIEHSTYDFRNPHENWDLGTAAHEFADVIASNGHKVRRREVHDGTDWPSWRNHYDDLFGALFPPKGS